MRLRCGSLNADPTQSLVWLLHNYFMPVLSMSETATRPAVQPASLAPLLKEYKALAKQTARDESLRASLQLDFTRLFRQLERWIGETKVSSLSVSGGDDDAETGALELLSNELLDKGGLVPVAKKCVRKPHILHRLTLRRRKRLPVGKRMLPPNADLWKPLLVHVQDTHPSFGPALLSCIAARLSGNDEQPDPTYQTCLLGWVVWIVDTWGEAANCDTHDAISQLLLGVQAAALSRDTEPYVLDYHANASLNAAVRRFVQLIETLLAEDDVLKSRLLLLLRPPEAQDRMVRSVLACAQVSTPSYSRSGRISTWMS